MRKLTDFFSTIFSREFRQARLQAQLTLLERDIPALKDEIKRGELAVQVIISEAVDKGTPGYEIRRDERRRGIERNRELLEILLKRQQTLRKKVMPRPKVGAEYR